MRAVIGSADAMRGSVAAAASSFTRAAFQCGARGEIGDVRLAERLMRSDDHGAAEPLGRRLIARIRLVVAGERDRGQQKRKEKDGESAHGWFFAGPLC